MEECIRMSRKEVQRLMVLEKGDIIALQEGGHFDSASIEKVIFLLWEEWKPKERRHH